MTDLKALPGRCEEASPLSSTGYIPCNAPATRRIKGTDQVVYLMCDRCADHNVKNRGATDLGRTVLTPVDLMLDASPFIAADEIDDTPKRIVHIVQMNDNSFNVVMDGRKASGLVFGEMLEQIVKLTYTGRGPLYGMQSREEIAAERARHEQAMTRVEQRRQNENRDDRSGGTDSRIADAAPQG